MNSASPTATDRVKLFVLGRHPCSTHLYTNSISIWKADSLLLHICQNINISLNSPVGEALACSLWWLLPWRKSDQVLLKSPTHTLGLELSINSLKLSWQGRPSNNGWSLFLCHSSVLYSRFASFFRGKSVNVFSQDKSRKLFIIGITITQKINPFESMKLQLAV